MAEASRKCPYVGLRPFREPDREFFFGRERDSSLIISNLYASPLTILYGASGVGKSSLLCASVIPRLRESPDTAVVLFSDWRRPDFLDGFRSACIESIAAALGAPFEVAPAVPLDALLADAAARLGGPVLLILDQFEDYLLSRPEARADDPFETQFARAVNRVDVDAGFLLALREDWLSRLDRFRVRIPNLFDNILEILHLDRTDAIGAILCPLKVYNRRYASPGSKVSVERHLVREVLEQVGSRRLALRGLGASPGVETSVGVATPFLQLVMERLWNEDVRDGAHRLRLMTFTRLGGAEGIVSSYLDTVMKELSSSEQKIAALMFVFLVTPSGTKIPYTPEDLASNTREDAALVRGILKKLADRRILTRNDPPERFEVYHDALAHAVLRWRIEFEKQEDRADAERKEEEQRLLAKRKAAEARRFRRLAIALGVCLILVVLVATLFLLQRRISFSRELAVASIQQSETGDPELGILLALQAVAASSPVTEEAESALHRALQRSRVLVTIREHSGAVNGVVAGQDGAFATAGDDGTARIFDRSGKSVRKIDAGQGRLSGVVMDRGGTRLGTIGEDGSAAVWDAASGVRQAVLRHDGEQIVAAAISPNGAMFVTGAGAAVRLWDASARELRTIVAHDKPVRALAFSPDGRTFATAGDDGVTAIWKTAGNKIRSFVPRSPDGRTAVAPPVRDVTFNPDGTRLATAADDGTSRIWDIETGRETAVLLQKGDTGPLAGHSNIIQSVAFSPDGQRVVTASWDRTARVWDANSGRELLVLRGHKGSVTAASFITGGTGLVTSSTDGEVRIWNTGPLPELRLIAASPDRLNRAAFSPDGKSIATAAADHTAALWDLESGRMRHVLKHDNEVTSVAFSRDGNRIATGSTGTAAVWDTASGQEIESLAHPELVVDVAFSPDSRMLATASWDPLVRVWNIAAKSLDWSAPAHARLLTAVAYNKRGTLLATVGDDGTAKVWNTASHQPVQTVGKPGGPELLSVAFSPNDELAAGGMDGVLQLVPVPSRTAGRPIPAHSDWLRGVTFSPDGRRLATAGRDGTVVVWDASSGRRLLVLDARSGPLSSVAFSPDGRRLATAGDDGTARVYTLDIGELRELAGSRVTRPLTDAECAAYLHRRGCGALF